MYVIIDLFGNVHLRSLENLRRQTPLPYSLSNQGLPITLPLFPYRNKEIREANGRERLVTKGIRLSFQLLRPFPAEFPNKSNEARIFVAEICQLFLLSVQS